VNSLVSDILLPPISLLPGLGKNLDEKFAVLRSGPHHAQGGDYNTLKQARDDGAVVMAYGYARLLGADATDILRCSYFLNRCLNFLGIVLSLFLIVRIYQYLSDDTMIKKQEKCKFCRKWINAKVSPCNGFKAMSLKVVAGKAMRQLH
jgi:large conductance mechanosensitive channel